MRREIATQTGRLVDPLYLKLGDIDIEDIATALANTCRYGGHCRFYSVAEHSVLVSLVVEQRLLRQGRGHEVAPGAARFGLLHDASEAYLGDLVRPLKRDAAFAFYREAEYRAMDVIAEAIPHGADPSSQMMVHHIDNMILRDERDALFPVRHERWVVGNDPLGVDIQCLGPRDARDYFMARYRALWGV